MKVTVFGSGYVGLVTGACLAEVGHHVVCVDVDQAKIDRLNQGIIPIYEPGLDSYIERARQDGTIEFTTDAEYGVNHGLVQFIAVGTPPDEDGSADLKYVLSVARTVGEHMSEFKVVVTKSTVPVGTSDKVRAAVSAVLGERGVDQDFAVASNPEFLKEGAAISDFMKPDRIIVGTDSGQVEKLMKELYAPFNRQQDRLIIMDIRSAELTKYAANGMLATKISFMNEVANLAERLGADIEQVRIGIGSDPRIGYHFIYPGCGYGGSCFPKDVKALAQTATQVEYDAQLLKAVDDVNDRQKMRLVDHILTHFGNDLSGKKFALWGLSFKPQTDDMREATSRVVMEALWEKGATVCAYDPEAMHETRRIYGEQCAGLELVESKYTALTGADALVICTEWKAFRAPDFEEMRSRLNEPVVFDGRNLYDPNLLAEKGFNYYGIGRGLSLQAKN